MQLYVTALVSPTIPIIIDVETRNKVSLISIMLYAFGDGDAMEILKSSKYCTATFCLLALKESLMTKLMLNVCRHLHSSTMVFSGGSGGKESAGNSGDLGWIPRWGRSPGEGKGYPLQDSCLENSMDRGAWQAIVHGVAELETTEQQT